MKSKVYALGTAAMIMCGLLLPVTTSAAHADNYGQWRKQQNQHFKNIRKHQRWAGRQAGCQGGRGAMMPPPMVNGMPGFGFGQNYQPYPGVANAGYYGNNGMGYDPYYDSMANYDPYMNDPYYYQGTGGGLGGLLSGLTGGGLPGVGLPGVGYAAPGIGSGIAGGLLQNLLGGY